MRYHVDFTFSMTERHDVEATSAEGAIEAAKVLSPEYRRPDRYPLTEVSAVRREP